MNKKTLKKKVQMKMTMELSDGKYEMENVVGG
jgi:hypothetical protein